MLNHDKRRSVLVDGNTKLILEILGVSREEYLKKRDELIYKLHTQDKMTYNSLSFKFSIGKNAIANICNRLKKLTPDYILIEAKELSTTTLA